MMLLLLLLLQHQALLKLQTVTKKYHRVVGAAEM